MPCPEGSQWGVEGGRGRAARVAYSLGFGLVSASQLVDATVAAGAACLQQVGSASVGGHLMELVVACQLMGGGHMACAWCRDGMTFSACLCCQLCSNAERSSSGQCHMFISVACLPSGQRRFSTPLRSALWLS
jgi:hypothetical protein